MTWKSYAAVSGATVLTGWLVSSPPSNVSTPAAVAANPPVRSAAASDIEEQAARLQTRLRAVRAYTEPERNPFRFVARSQPAISNGNGSASGLDASAPVDLTPPAPRVFVAGIAEEQLAGGVQRTAVLSSPMGVLLVREGEEVLGYYRVSRIENESVELVNLADGTVTMLALGTPR